MDWRSVVKLDEGTIETIRMSLNIVVRASVIALAWVCLLMINMLFNWLIDFALKSVGADKIVVEVLSHAMLTFIVVVGIAATLSSLKDVLRLVRVGVKDSDVNSVVSKSEGTSDVEQKSPHP